MLFDGVEHFPHASPYHRGGFYDWHITVTERAMEVYEHLFSARQIGFVDHQQVQPFQYAGFHRLDFISAFRRDHENDRMSDVENIHLILANPDRFQKNIVVSRRVEHLSRFIDGLRETAAAAARRETSDENFAIEKMLAHSDTVAEQCAAGKWTRRIDGQDPDSLTLPS